MASEREGGRAREDLELSPSCSSLSLSLSLLPLLPKATAPLEPLPTRIMAAFFAPAPSPVPLPRNTDGFAIVVQALGHGPSVRKSRKTRSRTPSMF